MNAISISIVHYRFFGSILKVLFPLRITENYLLSGSYWFKMRHLTNLIIIRVYNGVNFLKSSEVSPIILINKNVVIKTGYCE